MQEYKRFKEASENLDAIPRIDRDVFIASSKREFEMPKPKNKYNKTDLVFALQSLLDQAALLKSHTIKLENITVESKMKLMLEELKSRDFISLPELVKRRIKTSVSVMQLKALELNRKGYIEIVQGESFGEVYFKSSEEVVH